MTRDAIVASVPSHSHPRRKRVCARGSTGSPGPHFAPETDEDYLDPWIATRLAVLWFGLMLDESRGDVELAVRAYHRGTPAARAGEGTEYLDEVRRRLAHYVRGNATSPAWKFLWRRWRLEPD